MHDSPPLARRDAIAERLSRGQTVVAATLAAEFGTSEDAIRRDLRALANEGLCRRVYGGALPISSGRPLAERVSEDQPRKFELAKAAATLIRPREFLFLDSGSANLELARALPLNLELTVATNSVDIAALLSKRADLQTIIVGGVVHPLVGGCIDASACHAVSQMNIERCFLGICALSAAAGISAMDSSDASFKRALLAASRERASLIITEKFSERAPYRIAALADVQTYIVEHDAPTSLIGELKSAGASVLTAQKA
jgi:DeoR/GlpR family transcriptional regulator of sugar metabolism